MYYIYFAQSLRNGKVYVGKTSKLPEERVNEHNKGSNSWSKQNGPFRLVYFESYFCLVDVTLREKYYKTGIGKRVKKAIVREFSKLKQVAVKAI